MLAPAGCWREAPPEIREYAPVPVPAVQLAKAEEPEETVSAPQAAAPAAAPPKVETAAKTPQLPETRPAEAPSPAKTAPPEPKAPTLVGTWRLVEGSERGQPMPPGMDVQFTFAADGTLSMRIAMPQMPEPRSQSGTYSVDGDQITISIERDTKSGKLTFEGNDRATLEVETVKFVLRRL